MLIHSWLGCTMCIIVICMVISGCTAVPMYRVTHWLYLGYSCMVTTCDSVHNSPWQVMLLLKPYRNCPTMKICKHKQRSHSLFPIRYHGRYHQLDCKLACHPKSRFQIPCIAAFPASLWLYLLLVARRQGWPASPLKLGGSTLCTRDSKILLTQKWVIY